MSHVATGSPLDSTALHPSYLMDESSPGLCGHFTFECLLYLTMHCYKCHSKNGY